MDSDQTTQEPGNVDFVEVQETPNIFRTTGMKRVNLPLSLDLVFDCSGYLAFFSIILFPLMLIFSVTRFYSEVYKSIHHQLVNIPELVFWPFIAFISVFAVLFAAIELAVILPAATLEKSILTIDRCGFTDRRVSEHKILWSEVSSKRFGSSNAKGISRAWFTFRLNVSSERYREISNWKNKIWPMIAWKPSENKTISLSLNYVSMNEFELAQVINRLVEKKQSPIGRQAANSFSQ